MNRKRNRPSPAELEAQADELLRKADHDMLEAIAANVQTLCEGFAELRQPSNDPEYLKRLQTSEAQRNAIANKVHSVGVFPDGYETWIGVSVGNRRNQADVREVARLLGEHLEAPVINHGPTI